MRLGNLYSEHWTRLPPLEGPVRDRTPDCATAPAAMPTLLDDLDAFYLEHRRFDALDG
jgi:hypothetical protein